MESLLMSRHWMYSQVYQHPTRKIYDEHLQGFLKELMYEDSFPVNEDKPEEYLEYTDSDILRELFMIKKHPEHRLYNHANKLLERKYRFRLVYKQNIDDKKIFTEYLAQTTIQDDSPQRSSLSTPTELIYSKILNEFSEGIIKNTGKSTDKKESLNSPVKLEDGTIKEAKNCSNVFKNVISTDFDYGYIFAEPDKSGDIKEWIKNNKDKMLLNGM